MRTLAREHLVHRVVLLLLLSLVVYGTVHELTAHARQPSAPPSAPSASAPAAAAARPTFREASADADVGPGEAEPLLAQHSGR